MMIYKWNVIIFEFNLPWGSLCIAIRLTLSASSVVWRRLACKIGCVSASLIWGLWITVFGRGGLSDFVCPSWGSWVPMIGLRRLTDSVVPLGLSDDCLGIGIEGGEDLSLSRRRLLKHRRRSSSSRKLSWYMKDMMVPRKPGRNC